MTNRSIVIQMSGRMTTTTPLLTLRLDKIRIQTSMMKTMRRNESLNTEPSLMRKIKSYTIPLVKGLHHRPTGRGCHRSTLNLNNDAEREHRPRLPTTNRSTLPTKNRSTLTSTVWADETHHESFAVETVTYTPGADKLQDSFTEELLNMQKRGDTNQIQAEAAWEKTRSIDTRHQQSIDKLPQQSIDINNTTLIDNHSIPKPLYPNGYAKAIDSRTLHVSQEDIADILQTANGVDNMFMHQRSNHEQKTTKEFYDAVGGIENSFKQRSRHTNHPSINIDVPTVTRQPEFSRRAFDPYGNKKFYWEGKDEYGVYRDDREFARDLDGHTIPVDNKDIRRLLERASKDEPAYICLPEHASQFTQTKLVPKIYSNDEINEMFYGVCGEHDRNKEAFQMKLDGYNLANYLHGGDEARHSQNLERDRCCSTFIDRQKTTPIDQQPPGRIDRHQFATPTHN
ncbi:hypothetical protein YC2023_051214 [Brassica napus]